MAEEMKGVYILKKEDLEGAFDQLSDWDIFAPSDPGKPLRFDILEKVTPETLDFFNTVVPAKRVMLPQAETILRFRGFGNELELLGPETTDRKAVLIGARPCDAASILHLDTVFGEGFPDPMYLDRRRRTTVVGLACNHPHRNCFCTRVGGSPHSKEGADILLTDLGPAYLVEVLTEKGEDIVGRFKDVLSEPTEEDLEVKRKLEAEAERLIEIKFSPEGLAERCKLPPEDEFWIRESASCLGCAICTYLCPTCTCFDINDERSGRRVRTWDSCQFPDFTVHSSGHNPRPTKASRLRNRFHHKFVSAPETTGRWGCFGCGRCITHCPAGINLTVLAARREEEK